MTTRRVIVDHVDLMVSDLEASRAFYVSALEPLGFHLIEERDDGASFGIDGLDDFGLNLSPEPTRRAHVAFVAEERGSVDAFYLGALRAGGRSNGSPGIYPEYGPTYYAAYVLDPDDNNIEAVHHGDALHAGADEGHDSA